MHRKKLVSAVAVMFLLVLVACGRKDDTIDANAGENAAGEPTINTEEPARERQVARNPPTATATLQGAPEDADFKGTITLTPDPGGVRVVAHLEGIDQDGPHGFHVHETGDCSHGEGGKHFTSAGGHFNPDNVEHACPPTEPRHAGDLGNIEVTNGTGHLETTLKLSLSGPNSVVGKAIILHANADDCKTQPTGNAGDRLACGVVTMGGAQ